MIACALAAQQSLEGNQPIGAHWHSSALSRGTCAGRQYEIQMLAARMLDVTMLSKASNVDKSITKSLIKHSLSD